MVCMCSIKVFPRISGQSLLWTTSMVHDMYVLLKALLPVCMKYTAQGKSQVANIAWGEAECHIHHKTLTKRAVYFHTNKVAVL